MHKPADGKDPQYRPEFRDGIRIDWDMPIPIEDGVVLRCDFFGPVAEAAGPSS
jgi:hypothetical protein